MKENDYIPEKNIEGGHNSIKGEILERIREQMKINICIIEGNKGNGTGFFCLIPFPNKKNQIPVLMTNNHVLSNEDIINGKIINVRMYNKRLSILIDSRSVYTNKKYDITIIEIKNVDGLDCNKFLEIDDSIYKENPYIYFKERSVYLIHHPKINFDSEFSIGKIKGISIDSDTIKHTCSTEPGSSGGPILDISTNKIVGIHKGSKLNLNVGTFIIHPIEEFYNENKNKIINYNFLIKEDIIDEIIIRYSRKGGNVRDYVYNYTHKIEGIEESISEDKLFGENFVKNNKYLCKIIIGSEEYQLNSYLKDQTNEVKKDKFQIKLKGISKVKDFSFMFCGCLSLDDVQGFDKINTKNITNFSYLFSYCRISSIPDISNWDTSKATLMNHMFCNCYDLVYIPDLSKWKTPKLKNIRFMFANCFNLVSIIGISEWDTNNLEYMDKIFYGCKLLKSLPDISNWKTNKIKSMNQLFFQCISLEELPDISKWDTSNLIDMSGIFDLCKSLKFLPDISKWNTSKVKSMRKAFSQCESLTFLPDISKWITFNVEDMSYMFFKCSNLYELPDLSRWNTTNLKDKTCIFFGCNKNLNIPKNLQTSFFENALGLCTNHPLSNIEVDN